MAAPGRSRSDDDYDMLFKVGCRGAQALLPHWLLLAACLGATRAAGGRTDGRTDGADGQSPGPLPRRWC